MHQANGSGPAGNATKSATHARKTTRIIPAIPKQLSRKSLDKTEVRHTPDTAESSAAPRANTSTKEPDARAGAEHASTKSDSNGSFSADIGSARVSSPTAGQSQGGWEGSDIQAGSGRDTAEPGLSSISLDSDSATGHEDAGNPSVSSIAVRQENKHELAAVAPQSQANGRLAESPQNVTRQSHDQSNVQTSIVCPTLGKPHSSQRVSVVFGNNVDSAASSPAPPASSGSWTSSHAPTPDGSSISPPPTTMNGFKSHVPRSHDTSSPLHSSQNTNQHRSSQNPPNAPYMNGHANHLPRQGVAQRPLQTPRSGSLGSNPSEPILAPPYLPYPSHPPAQAFNMSPVDAGSSSRSLPFSPYTPSFTPNRSSFMYDGRFQPEHDYHNTQALRLHAETLLASLDFADTLIQMPRGFSGPSQLSAHSFALSRSPKLRRALLNQTAVTQNGSSSSVRYAIDIDQTALFKNGGAFPLALRYLYSGNAIRRDVLQPHLRSPKEVMEWVLSYVVAGWYLEMPEIVNTGLGLASELLTIDNVETALEFALASDTDLSSPPKTVDRNGTEPAIAPPRYAPYAADFLFSILRFITWPLTNNFEVDTTVPYLESIKRVPDVLVQSKEPFSHSSRPSVSNPKLQGIQLGDFQVHSTVNRILSSLLLSVPTFVIQTLFNDRVILERLAPGVRASLLEAIVTERERRRVSAISSYHRLSESDEHGRLAPSVLMTLGSKETVEIPEAGSGLANINVVFDDKLKASNGT